MPNILHRASSSLPEFPKPVKVVDREEVRALKDPLKREFAERMIQSGKWAYRDTIETCKV